MTTIAYDGTTLAVDSLVTFGSLAFGTGKKLFKLKDGGFVAFSGNMSLVPEVLSWLQGGDKPVPGEDEDVNGLMIDKKGVAWEFGTDLRLFPACIPWAGGSGYCVALTAMRCGKTAVQAVEVACEMDIRTRGPIQSVKLKG